METRRRPLDASEEQLKSLISQAYPPVEVPAAVQEGVLKRLLAESSALSARRRGGRPSVWPTAPVSRRAWAGAALVVSLVVVLSLLAYNLSGPWRPSGRSLTAQVRAGSATVLRKGFLGRPVSTVISAGEEMALTEGCTIETTEGQEVALKLAMGPLIHVQPDSRLELVPAGTAAEDGVKVRLDRGGIECKSDGAVATAIEMPGVQARAAGADFRAEVTGSRQSYLASDKGQVAAQVDGHALVVSEWEELSTSLPADRMVRPQRPVLDLPAREVVTRAMAYRITGRAQPGSLVEIYATGGLRGETRADAQGRFEYQFRSSEEKIYDVWAVCTGPRGTSSDESARVRLSFDRTPPKLEIESPRWPDVTSSPVLLEGNTEPGARLIVNGSQAEVDGQGHFSVEIPLQPGDNDLQLRVSDAAGNEFVATMVIKLH